MVCLGIGASVAVPSFFCSYEQWHLVRQSSYVSQEAKYNNLPTRACSHPPKWISNYGTPWQSWNPMYVHIYVAMYHISVSSLYRTFVYSNDSYVLLQEVVSGQI
jgi:hypothetical protein